MKGGDSGDNIWGDHSLSVSNSDLPKYEEYVIPMNTYSTKSGEVIT